jgi:hypothetical protein
MRTCDFVSTITIIALLCLVYSVVEFFFLFEFLAQTLRKKLLEAIGDSLFTVLIDETTDFSNTIDMDVHIRWVQLVVGDDGRKRFLVREDFLCMLPLKNGTAETIYSSLMSCLHSNGLDAR